MAKSGKVSKVGGVRHSHRASRSSAVKKSASPRATKVHKSKDTKGAKEHKGVDTKDKTEISKEAEKTKEGEKGKEGKETEKDKAVDDMKKELEELKKKLDELEKKQEEEKPEEESPSGGCCGGSKKADGPNQAGQKNQNWDEILTRDCQAVMQAVMMGRQMGGVRPIAGGMNPMQPMAGIAVNPLQAGGIMPGMPVGGNMVGAAVGKLVQDYNMAKQSGAKLKPQTEQLVQATLRMAGVGGIGGVNPAMMPGQLPMVNPGIGMPFGQRVM